MRQALGLQGGMRFSCEFILLLSWNERPSLKIIPAPVSQGKKEDTLATKTRLKRSFIFFSALIQKTGEALPLAFVVSSSLRRDGCPQRGSHHSRGSAANCPAVFSLLPNVALPGRGRKRHGGFSTAEVLPPLRASILHSRWGGGGERWVPPEAVSGALLRTALRGALRVTPPHCATRRSSAPTQMGGGRPVGAERGERLAGQPNLSRAGRRCWDSYVTTHPVGIPASLLLPCFCYSPRS